MGQITRCPLVGTPCAKPITVEEKTFFLAEAEKPPYDKTHRDRVLKEAIVDGYTIKSALEEKGINAFTCKICEMIQTCAYGMADISQNNANVFMELGIMLALGKPVIILVKRGQEQQLNLPSDVIGIEVIPFEEYLDIIDPLREAVKKLPINVTILTPIENLEKIDPKIVERLEKIRDDIVKEFKKSAEEAKLDKSISREEKEALSPELSKKLHSLEKKLEEMKTLGLPADAETSNFRGHHFFNQGKLNEALTAFEWALELKPNDPEILCNRGAVYARLDQYEKAIIDFNRALGLAPNYIPALHNRSISYIRTNKYEEAINDLNRILVIDPEFYGAFYDLACVYSLRKQPDDALTYLEKAITKEKKYIEMAKKDKDFDNIRDDLRFKKLIGD